MRPRLSILAVSVLTVTLCAAALAQQSADLDQPAVDPWGVLTSTRNALAHAAIALPFEQSFVPAGFNSGDRETGIASFGLPRCVRWDYVDPDPRSYLLCDNTVLTWNQGEDAGRRQHLDGRESGPFELWLAPLDELERNYRATLDDLNGDHLVLTVRPSRQAEFDRAQIVIDRQTRLPVGFEYQDFEGNVTSFDFGDAELVDGDDPRFEPPPIEWIEEQE